jgi:hypothetical protein
MGHVICSVKTGPNQSIVKLNLFNYFEKKAKLHKTNKKRQLNVDNNDIILHLATHPRHRRCFLSPNRNLQPN